MFKEHHTYDPRDGVVLEKRPNPYCLRGDLCGCMEPGDVCPCACHEARDRASVADRRGPWDRVADAWRACWLACAGNLEVDVDAARLIIRLHARVAGKSIGLGHAARLDWALPEDTGSLYLAHEIVDLFGQVARHVEGLLRSAVD